MFVFFPEIQLHNRSHNDKCMQDNVRIDMLFALQFLNGGGEPSVYK